NVAYVIESARAIPAANNENALADDAQVIGDLASHQYAGDESERLGFNIRGALASADDQDVYRFTADGGTVVYIDIDDTSFGLDTIVEVIDVNDNVLARSDSSFEEATNPGLLVNNLTPGSVLPLFQLGAGSVESPNSLDAGMRVILDGTGKDNEYYVRVRTANGQSSGQYQLSIRLQETDEVAGSTVQLADIRFATDAITVSGAPLHSPLAGDATEDLNADGTDVDNTVLAFTEANAAHIGNLLTSDRGSLRVSGTIGNLSPALAFEPSDEVDVYQVDLFRQEIEPDVFDSENRFVSVTFDVDYADQLGRVNSSLSIFDSAGRLILHSRDSNVADDVGRPLEGDDPTNLTGGSTGVLDAYIGPVELPEGTYYVAVSSAIAIPSALDQLFVDAAPTDTNVRLMPINSIRRIADDRLDTGGADLHFGDQYTADRPIISPLFTDESIVPYGIDDVRLFVSYDGGISGGNRSSLASFNPFTGVMDRLIGQSGQPTGDIAARRDGELFAFSLGPQGGPENNGNVGNFLNISPANGAAVNVGDDGVTYMRNNQAGNDLEADPNAQLDVLALTFPLRDGSSVNTQAVNANERFFTVGQRDNNGRGGEIPDIYATNIFYTNVSSTGETTSLGSTDATFHRQFNGTIPYFPFHESTSPDIEWGFVDTGAVRNPGGFNACIADANCDGGEITGIAVDADAATTMYAVTDQGGFHVFDYTVNVPGLGGFLAAASNVIPTNYLGKLAPDPLDFASQNRGFIQFEGLSLGPRGITNQAYRDVFYGVSAEGWLYAFQIDGGQLAPAHVFYNGLSAIPLTFEGGASAAGASPHGLAFSIQEQNPWHFTDDRRADNGHGTVQTYDQSRINVVGDGSLYFGFEITGNAADNTVSRPDDDPLGEISPGGTQGSVISKAFSLEGYSPDDKPTLYFSYFLEVEDNDDYQPGPTQQRDSFRAYAAGDDGNWLLLATNNSFRDLGNNDEYDSYDTTDIPVQTLFDDSDAWRQARVDLSPLAGNENVKIRFDFSNAGAVRQTFGALELVAVDGDQIDDRSQLILRNEDFETVTLDSIVGKNVVIPAGSALADGDGFTVVGPDGPFTVTFITGLVPANPGEVSFSVSQSALEIAEAVINAVPASLRAISDGNGTISFLGATDVIVLGDSPIGQSNPVDIRQTSDQLIVPAGVNISSFDELTVNGLGTTTRFLFVEAVDATGAPDEFIFSPTESAFDIGARLIELLPDALDAVLELDGRITFIQGPITFAFGASDAVNTVGNLTVLENRLEIFVADGDNLVDGSQLVITDAFSGTTTITFVLNTVSEGPGTVNFFSGDTSLDIATRLQAALPASMDVRINITNDGIVLLADDANGAPNVFDQPIGGETITFPDGSVPLQNDTLRLIDQFLVTTVIDFVRVTVPTPPTVAVFNPVSGNNEGTVFFQTSDTPDIIAANYALATDPFYVNVNKGDTIESFGAFDSTTTDPDSSIINDANLGQFIQLPPSGGMIDGESIQISSPFGNVQVQFVNQAFGFGNQVFYNANESSAVIQSRLQALLPSNLRAIVTQNGTSGPVVQILGATDITVFNPMSLILTGPNAYSRDVLNLDIKDGNQIRNGEQIVIDSPFTAPVTLTFVRAGSTSNAPGTIEIFYSTTDLAADLYDRILQSLPQNLQSYIALDDDGVNVGVPGATGVVIPGIPPATSTTTDIDEFAIPIILPAGNELNDGEVLTIIRKDDIAGAQPINIFFRMGVGAAGPNEVVYALTDTQAQITQKLYDALPRSVQAFQVSSRELYLLNAASVATQAGSSIISFELAVGAIPLQVDSAMSSSEVADKLRIALAEAFGRLATVDGTNNALPDDYPVIGGNRIRIYNSLIVDPGSFSASSFDVNTVDPFDAFSTFSSSALPSEFYGLSRPTSFAGSQIDGAGGANNNIEGVYIDDIIVGFAERGEMVLDAPVNRTFTLNPEVIPDNRPQAVQPERQNETLTGGYSLDIRTSDEFGVPQDYDPINLLLQEESGLGRSFDTNDRLVDGAVTLIAQAGTSLIDGDTFVINDGTRQLTFEFDSILETGVTIGNVAVPFDPIGIEARDVATSIRNAINSPQSRGVLDISAATGNSQEVGGASGTHVELFGPAISINPGGGRFLKVDLVEEETFQGRETSKLFPVIDHDNQTVTYVSQGDQQARAAVTGFVDGTVDVLVATGKIGDQVNTGETVDDAPVVFFNAPGDDVDYVRIYLTAGQTIDIDLDTVGFARGAEQLELPVITVLDGDGGTSTNGLGGLAQTSLLNTSAAPGEAIGAAFLKFQATTSGYYDVAVSSSPFFAGGGFFFGADFGEYSLTIRPDAATSAAIPDRDVLMVDYHFGNSDENRVKDQGQIIIASNFISDSQRFGVFATTGSRGEAFATNPQNNGIVPEDNPRPGSVNLLRNINTDGLIPGAVINNNVVVNSGAAGIRFSGGTAGDGEAPAPVPYGRIVNNTVVGSGGGSGIQVA
ncbi:MAG: peptidase, partial [Rubripirellula sp.]